MVNRDSLGVLVLQEILVMLGLKDQMVCRETLEHQEAQDR